MNSSAQAFEVYRLLIGAIIALLILVIIVGAINYFDNLTIDVSRQRFFSGLSNAVDQPNGESLMIENVVFRRGEAFTSRALALQMGIGENCIEFAGSDSSGISMGDGIVTVKEKLKTDVFVKCETNSQDNPAMAVPSGCEIACEIGFGEPIS
ncbi:MAG: hypothetical protein AABW99_01590 [archaeon]